MQDGCSTIFSKSETLLKAQFFFVGGALVEVCCLELVVGGGPVWGEQGGLEWGASQELAPERGSFP